MSLKPYFQNAITDLNRLALHSAMGRDMRIAGPFCAAAQNFVIAAEKAGFRQSDNIKPEKTKLEDMQQLARMVEIFAFNDQCSEQGLKDSVQLLVDHFKSMEITATNNPFLNSVREQQEKAHKGRSPKMQ